MAVGGLRLFVQVKWLDDDGDGIGGFGVGTGRRHGVFPAIVYGSFKQCVYRNEPPIIKLQARFFHPLQDFVKKPNKIKLLG